MVICCFILCMCSGCSYNSENKSNHYIVLNINGDEENAVDDYFFHTSKAIYRFSISEQEIIDSIRCDDGGFIDDFAICDEYVFFLTGRGMPGEPEKIWRYNRESHICELYLVTENCYRMTVHDGYLLYGHDDIYACPINGNPDEDCISLMEQFFDGDSIAQSQEILYQGWRIWRVYLNSRHTYHITQIIDEEKDAIILSNSIGMPNSAGVDMWMGGEWIYFTEDGGYFYYQKGFESDKQLIDCLSDWTYFYSEINSFNMTVEGEKIIGILPVLKNLRTDDAKKDVLFEIDMKNNSSRIIYDTKNSRTRIIGYQEGMIYLLKDDIIYEEDLEKESRKKLLDLQQDGFYDFEISSLREFNFYWQGDNLIIWTILDNQVKIKSISISDQEL